MFVLAAAATLGVSAADYDTRAFLFDRHRLKLEIEPPYDLPAVRASLVPARAGGGTPATRCSRAREGERAKASR